MYRITVDVEQALVEVAVTGFWSVEEVAQFGADLRRAVEPIVLGGRRHATLYDYTQAVIQSQEVVAAFQRLALASPARRIALYTGGSIAKLQARRIATMRTDMVVFDDRKAALAWLREDEKPSALLMRRFAGQ